MAAPVDLDTLWSAAGVIAGFQIAAFTWRITREITMADAGEPTWLPLADLLNLVSLAMTLLGVFVATALGLVDAEAATVVFAWAVLLLAAWPLAVAGHYELFNRRPRQQPAPPVTRQETVVILAVAVVSIAFWAAVLWA